jgi:hypothetical protein
MILQNTLLSKALWCLDITNLLVLKPYFYQICSHFRDLETRSTHDVIFLNHSFVSIWLIKPQYLIRKFSEITSSKNPNS